MQMPANFEDKGMVKKRDFEHENKQTDIQAEFEFLSNIIPQERLSRLDLPEEFFSRKRGSFAASSILPRVA